MTPESVMRDDGGFTLVELLIVVVIEALIVAGLGSAFILVMNNSTSVKENLERTADARNAGSYLVSDARNSSGPETSLSDTVSCPDPSPPVAGTPAAVVRFNWNSTSSAGATTANVVNYVLVSNTLLRRYCRSGSLVSDIALARNVTSVAVACAPTANCSGTPTSISATITATNVSAGGAAFQYTVKGAFRKALAVGAVLPLSISGPATLPAWTVNRPYPATTIVGAGGDGNYIWSASGLPAGLTINASTGVISGTPTSAGAPTATITLNDVSADTPATRQYVVTINVAPTITTTSPLPGGNMGVAYSRTLAGSGGTTAYTWSATGLPAGLALNSSTGVISGTPTASGTSTVAATLTDAAGAIATKNLSLTISGPTITSVVLANGGSTQGRIQEDDTITVVFSAQMRVSSFCSAWSNDANNQSLNSDGNVTVTLNNGTGATNDSITVTSASCTFNFGSINMGSNAYVSGGSATYFGNGSEKSTISWTAATRTLVITLGNRNGSGTTATVSSSTPVYTASGSIVSSTGVAISNSPYTLATAQQF